MLSTFTASDGDNIAIQDWPLPEGVPVRGVVVLVHGLGEHAGRYDALARFLNDRGFAVRGYDQYGHGESGGQRGAITSPTRLLDDLADVIDSVVVRISPATPVILLGHSMGGLVAARLVSLKMRKVQGLVLSSPALDPGLGWFQKLLLAVLPRWAPNLQVGNGLKPQYLSHDPEVVRAYRADRVVHDRITPRLARFIADAGVATRAMAARWTVPTLLLYAGADKLVSPSGSREFAAAAPAKVMQAQCFDGLYHEIFNEPERDQVLDALGQWLDQNF
jgi:alpha-beta hydrolase superfamily lysophospholipase